MSVRCLFNGNNCEGIASSKEHVINNSRRIFIKNRGADLGNMKARFRGITCKNCNSDLGEIEERTWSGLAIATLWKVLAGNINNVFERAQWAQIQQADMQTIKHVSEIARGALLESKIFPENMFGYDLSYSGITGVDGVCSMSILTDAEGVAVLQDKVSVTNAESREQIEFDADFLLYHSHQSNGHRMVFILPLIPQTSTPWVSSELKISHKGFGKLAKDYIENGEEVSCQVYAYFQSA